MTTTSRMIASIEQRIARLYGELARTPVWDVERRDALREQLTAEKEERERRIERQLEAMAGRLY